MLPLIAKYNNYSVNHNLPSILKVKTKQNQIRSKQNKENTSWNSLLHFHQAGEIQNSTRVKENLKFYTGINTDSHQEKYFSLEIEEEKF